MNSVRENVSIAKVKWNDQEQNAFDAEQQTKELKPGKERSF